MILQGSLNVKGEAVPVLNFVPRHERSALDRSERSASHTGRFTLEESTLDTHWIEGWLGPSAGLNAVSKMKISP